MRSLVEILRSTLQKLEANSDFRQDDPAVIELKKHIVRAIAELEIVKTTHYTESEMNIKDSSIAEDSPAVAKAGSGVSAGSNSSTVEPDAAAAGIEKSSDSDPASYATNEPMLANNGTPRSS